MIAVSQSIEVKSLTMGGVLEIMEELDRAHLPLPELGGERLSSRLQEAADNYDKVLDKKADYNMVRAADAASNLRMQQVVIELVSSNIKVVWAWLVRMRPFVVAVLKNGTNLEETAILELPVASAIKLFRAILQKAVDEGVLTEMQNFFVGWFPQKPGAEPVAAEVAEMQS